MKEILKETFYPVDKQGRRIDTGEKIIGWKPGYIGYYYNSPKYYDEDDNKRRVWVKNFDDYNDRKTFEKAVQAKGGAAPLAYKYNIMPNYEKKEDRVINWLASDSFYNEDSFFYVKNLPGYENKTVAFQLRLSNHFVDPHQWFNSHMRRLYTPRGGQGRKNQMSQFGLCLMVDRFENNVAGQRFEKVKTEDVDMFNKYGQTFYETDLNLDEKTEDQKKKIDEFFTNIGIGKNITVTFQELEYMFGEFPPPKKYGGDEYDDVNFTERENIKGRRGKLYPFKGENIKEKVTIPYDVIEKVIYNKNTEKINIDGKTYYMFKYKDVDLALDDNMNIYRRGVKSGKLQNRVIPDDTYSIEENKIRKLTITESEIKKMIIECVKQIRKRRLV